MRSKQPFGVLCQPLGEGCFDNGSVDEYHLGKKMMWPSSTKTKSFVSILYVISILLFYLVVLCFLIIRCVSVHTSHVIVSLFLSILYLNIL